MKSFILLFFIVVLAKKSVQQNNVLQSRLQTRIVGGKPARPGQFPYHVGVFHVGRWGNKERCGGTIISNRHILTAAHCLINNNTGQVLPSVLVIVGTNEINDVFNPGKQTTSFITSFFLPILSLIDDFKIQEYIENYVIEVGSDSIVTHKDYNSHTANNDIGLISLSEPLTFNRYIRSAKLPSRSFILTRRKIISTGWGLTSDAHSSRSNVLLYMTSNVVPENECKYRGFSPKIHICINSPGYSICHGDSGGPSVVEDSLAEPVVVGVSSYASTLGCTKNEPQVLTRVSSYLDWIHNNTGILIEN